METMRSEVHQRIEDGDVEWWSEVSIIVELVSKNKNIKVIGDQLFRRFLWRTEIVTHDRKSYDYI